MVTNIFFNTAPSDYDAIINEVLTFSPSVTRLPVNIPIEDDDIVETVENFFASLSLRSSPPGSDVDVNPSQAEIRITDNDGMKILTYIFALKILSFLFLAYLVTQPRFETPTGEVPENDGPEEVCVVIDQDLERDVQVTIQTDGRTATSKVTHIIQD